LPLIPFPFLSKLFYIGKAFRTLQDMNTLQALKKYFAYDGFLRGQSEIIESILQGNQVIAILPTGAGKSLCYQLPALISENFSIVISPLIALMKDQVDNLNKTNEVAAFINSTMSFSETEEVFQKIAFGKIKLLYLAPERLDNKKFADRIKVLKPNFLFVDEAHCISEWGHNFRPSYTKLREFIEYCSIKKVSAFTATATPEVVRDIKDQLNFKEPEIFVKGFERENLHLNVLLNAKKNSKVLELLSGINGSTIIYTSSRKKAEEVSQFLTAKGINCSYYHAGLSAIERRRVQEEFINDGIRVICATNAFGMGIDKKDIRLIIHYNMPGSIENYYQEIGRAGRDNEQSNVYLLYDDKDLHIQNYFISNSHPTKDLIQKIYAAINDFNQVAVGNKPENELIIDSEYISKYTNSIISRGLLHSSLKFLENAGYLKQVSEFEKKDTIQFLMSKDNLEQFVKRTSNDELKNILLLLLREIGSELFRGHKQISVNIISNLLGISEESLAESLSILDNLGIISYRPSIEKETVLLIVPRLEKERLQLNYKKINEAYLNSKQKLDKMIDFVFTNECRFKYILNYFGEKADGYKCGKCDNCSTTRQISDSAIEYISEMILKTLAESGKQFPEASVIKIIRGEREKESFEKFESFGAASNYGNNEIKIVIQNLISKKLIIRSPGGNKFLELTKEGLRQTEELIPVSPITNNYEADLGLFHALREVRKNASQKFIQTQHLICPDKVLRLIAKEKPKNKTALVSIEGFNNRMMNKVGDEFLEVINSYSVLSEQSGNNREIPANIKETYNLLQKKYSLKEIAQLRKLSEPVISMQVETILEYDKSCDVNYLFDKDNYELITGEIRKGFSSLKDLKERLPSKITFAQIRIAVAKTKASSL